MEDEQNVADVKKDTTTNKTEDESDLNVLDPDFFENESLADDENGECIDIDVSEGKNLQMRRTSEVAKNENYLSKDRCSNKSEGTITNSVNDGKGARTVILMNFLYYTPREEIQKIFDDCGEIETLVTAKDCTSYELGLAYLTFKNIHSVQKALAKDGHPIQVMEKREVLTNHDKSSGEYFTNDDPNEIKSTKINNESGDGSEKSNTPYDGDEKYKMFVGGLAYETTEESLQQYFARFGELTDCQLVKKKNTGRSCGYGFITFADCNNVDVVLKAGPHKLDGRSIEPKSCKDRPVKKIRSYRLKSRELYVNAYEMKDQEYYFKFKSGRNEEKDKINVKGLPPTMNEDEIKEVFSQHGPIKYIRIEMHGREEFKGCFIDYHDEETATKVVTVMNHVQVKGNIISARFRKPLLEGASKAMAVLPITLGEEVGVTPAADLLATNGGYNCEICFNSFQDEAIHLASRFHLRLARKTKIEMMDKITNQTEKNLQKEKNDSENTSKPKRPMSSFFLFLKENRAQIEKDNPELSKREICKKASEYFRAMEDKTKEKNDSENPSKPKRPRSSFFFFLNENRDQIEKDNPFVSKKVICKKASELFNAMEDTTKWHNMHLKEKAEYDLAMEVWKAENPKTTESRSLNELFAIDVDDKNKLKKGVDRNIKTLIRGVSCLKKDKFGDIMCSYCDVRIGIYPRQVKQHLTSEQHQRNETRIEQDQQQKGNSTISNMATGVSEAGTRKAAITSPVLTRDSIVDKNKDCLVKDRSGGIRCTWCNKQFLKNCLISVKDHLNGRKHQYNLYKHMNMYARANKDSVAEGEVTQDINRSTDEYNNKLMNRKHERSRSISPERKYRKIEY